MPIRRGPKPQPPERLATKVLRIRVTAAEREITKRLAERECEGNISDLVRTALSEYRPRLR